MPNSSTHIPKKILSKKETLLLHGVGFVTGDSTIKLSYPFVFHPGLQVTVKEPGDAKWIFMMIPIVQGSLITNIRIAYHLIGINSKVSIIRLVEQQEPISATVVHNHKIESSFSSIEVISSECSVLAKKSILLNVCMDFNSKEDIIEFGSIEISYIPNFEALSRTYIKEKKVEEIKESYKLSEEIGKRSFANLFSKKHNNKIISSK